MKTCTICVNPQRMEIDQMLVAKTPLRTVAKQTGTSHSALFRHSQHIAGAIAKATGAALASTSAMAAAKVVEQAADAQTLLSQVQQLNARAIVILDAAQDAGKHHTALAAIREVRGCLELLGKLSGELQARQTNVAVAVAVERSEIDVPELIERIIGSREEQIDNLS